MYTKYKIVPFCPYHFVHTILSNTILSVYHFVRTILSIPFCPIPFCPYTILSVPFCPVTIDIYVAASKNILREFLFAGIMICHCGYTLVVTMSQLKVATKLLYSSICHKPLTSLVTYTKVLHACEVHYTRVIYFCFRRLEALLARLV